ETIKSGDSPWPAAQGLPRRSAHVAGTISERTWPEIARSRLSMGERQIVTGEREAESCCRFVRSQLRLVIHGSRKRERNHFRCCWFESDRRHCGWCLA